MIRSHKPEEQLSDQRYTRICFTRVPQMVCFFNRPLRIRNGLALELCSPVMIVWVSDFDHLCHFAKSVS